MRAFRPSADRWFWIGFQLAGWGYLLVAFSGRSQAQLGSQLITTHVLTALHERMPIANPKDVMVEWHSYWYGAEVLRRSGPEYFIHYTGYGSNWDEWVGPDRIRGHQGPFLHIGHSLLSLAMALAGGTVAACLGARARSRRWFWIAFGGLASAVVAISLLAITSDSELAASSAWSLLLLVLLAAALAACTGLTRDRSFALGFAIVGCGYLLLHFGPGLENSIGPKLLSTRLLQQVDGWLHPNPPTPASPMWSSGVTPLGMSGLGMRTYVYAGYTTGQPMSTCVLAGHSILATLLSLLGGLAALWLSRGRVASGSGIESKSAELPGREGSNQPDPLGDHGSMV